MDIKKLAVAATTTLHLRDSNDDPLYNDAAKTQPVTVTLYGPGSKQYAAASARQNNRMLDKLKRKGKTEQTPEQIAVEKAEFLADCTETFTNLEYGVLTGAALAKAVYADLTIGFIADQVSRHLGDWANFSTPSTTT